MERKLTLNQDLYQSKRNFDMEVLFSKKVIDHFPTLQPDTVRVVVKAIITKLSTGVSYDHELEEMIKIVYPVIIQK
jgi:hypothetical protein